MRDARLALVTGALVGLASASAPLAIRVHSQSGSTVSRNASPRVERREGAIVRGPVTGRRLALVFTAHEFAEGAPAILDTLVRHRARASFFLTGTFVRNPSHAAIIRRIAANGHYVGPHSDAHLLYCPWEGPKRTLVSRPTFAADLQRNYDALAPFGITRRSAPFFLPPYEWYNEEISAWTRELGLILICHTTGTRSNADYTGEGTPQFVPSQVIFDSILAREREDPHGLNGFILLLHLGAGPGRADLFHRRFGDLTDQLAARGYQFVGVDTLLGGVR
jgi:peptidoglycan/xylan/chitin deacetylase (PgdA/CDA1 family)